MIYPVFLHKNDVIGICAPSAGVGHKLESFDFSLHNLHEQGYRTKETPSVRVDDPRGGDGRTRAEELVSLFTDDEVTMVMAAAGGDFLDEILPYVDFKTMKKHPKWLMGASDPTGLLFPFTTKFDVATLYGENAGGYDLDPKPTFLKNNLKFLKGDLPVQKSYPRWMSVPPFEAEEIVFDAPSQWQSNVKELDVNGRCIGGCIDVLKDLIGTPYDGAKDFVRRYQDDGIIWYFDNFSLSAEVLYRTLLQFKYAGWFKHTKAVILGRTLFPNSDTGMDYMDALTMALPDLPVLGEADIGHTLPRMTMINGAVLHLEWKRKKATLTFSLD